MKLTLAAVIAATSMVAGAGLSAPLAAADALGASPPSAPPAIGLTAAMVSTSGSHTCAVTDAGGLLCWGDNYTGQLGDATLNPRGEPGDVFGLTTGVAAVTTGDSHTCALTTAGGVQCWGDNSFGESGGSGILYTTPSPVPGLTNGASAIVAGDFHTCALMIAGGVQCWGDNSSGQLGDGTTTQSHVPVYVSGLTGVLAIAAGGSHTCAVLSSGATKCWGANGAGQLGDATQTERHLPVSVWGLSSGISSITAGASHTCALNGGGAVTCWGDNSVGQLGDGSTTPRLIPTAVSGLSSGIAAVAAGGRHTCAITSGGATLCWGGNADGQLGDGTTTGRLVPTPVINISSASFLDVGGSDVNGSDTCAVTSAGGLKCWGSNTQGQLGSGPGLVRPIPGFVAGGNGNGVSAGGSHSCSRTASGGAVCWGNNFEGQLGDGTRVSRGTPAPVSGLTNVLSISSGQDHACAITSGGALQCWGANGVGQLGDTTTTRRVAPVAVSGLSSGVAVVAAGGFHTCALTSGGAVWCWGDNTYGQLGVGTYDPQPSHVPVPVTGLSSGVLAIAVGTNHSCAVTASRGVKCWGDNQGMQLGQSTGTSTSSNVPIDVPGLSGVSALSAGLVHTCALTTTGGVKCWGTNTLGQLGSGAGSGYSGAYDVLGLTSGVQSMDAGDYGACATLGTGVVRCWGDNTFGQVGDGTFAQRSTPVDVSGLSGALAVSAGGSHTCALINGGSTVCWGSDQFGQVGVGRLIVSSTPVPVIRFGTQYLLTTSVTPSSGGSISVSPISSDGYYSSGTVVRLTAAPAYGYTFSGWSGDFTGSTNPHTVTLSAPRSVTAAFSLITRVINVTGDLAFGNVTVGSSATRTITIGNTGDGTLTVTGISYPPGFSGEFSGTIVAGGSHDVLVTFAPTSGTTYSGTVTVYGNQTSGTNTLAASGMGFVQPTLPPPSDPAPLRISSFADFDGDGKDDLLLRDTQNGDVLIWLMNGTAIKQEAVLWASVPLAWRIVGVGDFDGDRNADLIWRNIQTGDVSAWLMSGTSIKEARVLWYGVPLAWQVVGAQDLDGDGNADLMWRHAQTGDVSAWLMKGVTIKQADVLWYGVPLTWQITGMGDLDGDGNADLMWRETQTGDVSTWLMNGTTVREAVVLWYGVPLAWQIAGMGDLDDDGKADLMWRHTQSGDVSAWLMNGSGIKEARVLWYGVPLGWHIAGMGDLDGDGKADLVWRHMQFGDVSAWLMDGVTLKQATVVRTAVSLAWQIQ